MGCRLVEELVPIDRRWTKWSGVSLAPDLGGQVFLSTPRVLVPEGRFLALEDVTEG